MRSDKVEHDKTNRIYSQLSGKKTVYLNHTGLNGYIVMSYSKLKLFTYSFLLT